MRWYFRDISDDPSEKELTQQDQFNNDEVAIAEALVRESIQNSTDARAEPNATVRVRFSIIDPTISNQHQIFRNIVADLAPHLRACDFRVPAPNEPVPLLVIEDFGTTGLTGSVEEKDDKQFSGFWRRFGRSNKGGAKGGRWGLGKLVFPSASAVRAVVGLTRRVDDAHEWVMGQAVLRNHTIDGVEHDSVGFWCSADGRKKGVPSDDHDLYSSLCDAAKLSRGLQPGLSLVIPYVLPEITKELLLTAAIRNYYFPILTERLIVVVGDVELNANTFDAVAASLPEGSVSSSVLNFVRQMQNCRDESPLLIIPREWQEKDKRISGELLGADAATDLRDRFRNDKLIFVRAPLSIKDKNNVNHTTNIDLFFKKTHTGERGQTLVVRGAITVPTEGRRANFLDCHAALIALDEPISRLLGDAENPAHTQWNERAEKLRAGWHRGPIVLRRVCPSNTDGSRKLREENAYIPGEARKYYRHLVRTPWYLVSTHGEASKFLLVSSLNQQSYLLDQLAARQFIIASPTLIAAARKLYTNPQTGQPRYGAGAKGPGSPRRLALVANQLSLTFDIRGMPVDKFMTLLPSEFRR
jgi:hypothetical protein